MIFPIYLAMTAQEFRHCGCPPPYMAWMACHFSSYGKGLSNIPEQLPENALLIINDRTPPHSHDPEVIVTQLLTAVDTLRPCGVLLDFESTPAEQALPMAQALQAGLPCPVGLPAGYDGQWEGPIFLPPIPPYQPVEEALSAYRGKNLWLELEWGVTTLTLHSEGCQIGSGEGMPDLPVFADENLHCHYTHKTEQAQCVFSLQRTREDTVQMLSQAQELGVSLAVGLYQQYPD